MNGSVAITMRCTSCMQCICGDSKLIGRKHTLLIMHLPRPLSGLRRQRLANGLGTRQKLYYMIHRPEPSFILPADYFYRYRLPVI